MRTVLIAVSMLVVCTAYANGLTDHRAGQAARLPKSDQPTRQILETVLPLSAIADTAESQPAETPMSLAEYLCPTRKENHYSFATECVRTDI